MKIYLVKLACWILTKYKIEYILIPDISNHYYEVVYKLVVQVEGKFKGQSGEFKRHQVLRASKNVFPNLREKDIAYYIELAVRALG